ncbi:MAG: YafY family transcriptional regulator [Burkholderiales bacterium]|nr:YafY family transcriptional regulator [Burkholderiales bacterium]
MDRTERFYRIDRLLAAGKPVAMRRFLDELEVSRATFKRDIEYLRDRFNAPIEWNREYGGYVYRGKPGGAPFQLPGLWFSPSEIEALLTMHAMLDDLQPGLIGAQVAPLRSRLEALIAEGDVAASEVRKRVRMLPQAARTMPTGVFETIAAGTLKRRRVAIRYAARSTAETTERTISPQRLVHYRDNWYVDAWCHLRDGLRKFAIDAIVEARLTDQKAKPVDLREVEREFNSGYGIFSGTKLQWAKLRFAPSRARWIAQERWHPQQRGRLESDGSYVLELPYTDTRELMMDILKYGADVRVLGPRDLADTVAAEIRRMAVVL